MRMRQLAIATLIAGFAFGALAAPATAQSTAETPQKRLKKSPAKKPLIRHLRTSGQIACTPAGCGRIPANCHPTQGYRWDGTPTGFDVVVCP
jgi:hypothetical protein